MADDRPVDEPIQGLSSEEADALVAEHFPQGLGRGRVANFEALVDSIRPLNAGDVAIAKEHVESGRTLGTKPEPLKAIRNTHHRAAQLLAVGVDETVVAKLCNYSIGRISILKADPAFSELLAYYAHRTEEEWGDFVSTAANLSLDFLGLLQQQLDETPEKFTPNVVMDAIRLLADRSGNAPTIKTHNVNVNLNLGDRLRAARERAQHAVISSSQPIPAG